MPKQSKNAVDTEAEEADFYYALADRARTLRGRSTGLTLAKCGELMGVTESMASLKFKGAKWSAFEVRVMAQAFGVPAGVLYGDEPMPDPVRPAIVTPIPRATRRVKSASKDYRVPVSRPVVHLPLHPEMIQIASVGTR